MTKEWGNACFDAHSSLLRHSSFVISHFHMPRYTYIALDSRGQESTGLVEASTTNEAIGELRRAGYFPTHVYEEGAPAAAQPKASRKKEKAPRAERKAGGMNIVLFQRKT